MNLTYVIAVWLIGGALMHAQSATMADDSPDSRDVRRLESVWNEAHLRADADALERLCADDLQVIVPGMRQMSRSESIGVLRAGRIKFDRYETSDVRIRLYGDTAVVTGLLQRTRSVNGKSMDDDWHFTKTYAKRSGQWRVVRFHASPNTP
jgi:uncharacterized protein (TIGR02246 family)